MKIEKLTENKIRIIINKEELTEKNIDIQALSKDSKTAHSIFQKILIEAEKQVGFKAQDCRLFIEAFSTSEGFVVFTLTKYKNENNNQKSSNKPICKRKSLKAIPKNAIYKFSTFEEFCNFCIYCNNSKLSDLKGLSKKISLYEYKNTYFLTLTNIHQEFENSKLFFASISEFSNLVSNSSVFKSKLEEHGKIIFKTNAIKNGIKYFASI